MGNNLSIERRRYQKALETLVFLANKDPRQYWVLKAIYVADKEHLKHFGRQIFGDRYIAMKWGPVPSLAYDIVKSVRRNAVGYSFPDPKPFTALDAPDNRTIKARRQAQKRMFSASEIGCLNDAYNRVKKLTFPEVRDLTHDAAYDGVEQDDDMSLVEIILTLENGAEVLEYINE